ncbi:MAG: isoprenylcysteine carboxylmethyltransferase family protein [Vicinamibacterales bacterium]
MNQDEIFRIALLLIFSAILPIGVYYRLKSQATRERLDRRQEGLFMLATLRPVAGAFWIGLIAWLINPSWMAWSAMPLPPGMRWAAVGVAVVGGVLFLWTFRWLGPNLTDTVVTRKTHSLVVRGPYQWIRHPFYVAVALLMLGISLTAANWFLLLTGALVLSLLVLRTRTEEDKLTDRFGDSYRVYMQTTGRFLPRLRTTPRSNRG